MTHVFTPMFIGLYGKIGEKKNVNNLYELACISSEEQLCVLVEGCATNNLRACLTVF